MNIIISNADERPIYEQILDCFRQAIIKGELTEGELLPSIRSLAKDLRISVITTKRAYDELEKEGYINTVAGKGCYVAPMNRSLVRERNLSEIEALMKKIMALSEPLGITEAELSEIYNTLKKEEKTF